MTTRYEEGESPLKSLPVVLEPDPLRTMLRPFSFAYPEGFEDGRPPRSVVVAQRVLAMPHHEAAEFTRFLMQMMDKRHRDAEAIFRRRYDELDEDVRALPADDQQKLLIGATFSEEYAFESAALFNPSIVVAAPGEDEGKDGTRFLLSLRGIGEGHISSVTFRTGTWHADGTVTVDEAGTQAIPPRIVKDIDGGGARLECDDSQMAAETVIFPTLPSQRQGVEDLRMVHFTDDGSRELVGTYTAFDGRNARTEILHGIDFRTVEMRPLTGKMAGYKGMALFPRRIDGQYVMLGRMDNERIWLLRSDDLYRWDDGTPILAPKYEWEWVQIGNCGSPIEIDEGWLVLTHGVAPMRGYCMGACLLDKADPTRVIKRMARPLLTPAAESPGGYVPNVVYSCGSLVRDRDILVPYAVGDRTTNFATGKLDDMLAMMVPD